LFDSFSFSLTNWMVSTVIRIYVSLIKLYDKTTYFIMFNITLAFTSSCVFCRYPANSKGVYLSISLTKMYLIFSKIHSVKRI
jgi:hypothetical protein